jgi:hypothetical protein
VITVRYGFNRFPNDSYQRSAGYDLFALDFASSFLRDIQRPSSPTSAGAGTAVTVIDQTHRSPRVHQYSFDVQL